MAYKTMFVCLLEDSKSPAIPKNAKCVLEFEIEADKSILAQNPFSAQNVILHHRFQNMNAFILKFV